MNAQAKSRLQVAVASRNPVKLRASEDGFRAAFPGREIRFETLAAASGVRDQPFGDEETLLGARNRVIETLRLHPEIDFAIGLEGGIVDEGDDGMHAFAWVVVRDRDGTEGRSRTASFELPPAVVAGVRAGRELGHVNDEVFGRENSKHEEGAVGILTGGALGRAGLYQPSVLLALIPFLPDFAAP